MKIIKSFISVTFLLLVWFGIPNAQPQFQPQLHEPGTPFYHVDVARFPTEVQDTSQVQVFIRVPYDDLQFVKYDSVYRASYEVSIVVFDKEGIQADGEIRRHEVEVQDFKTTNARDTFDNSRYSFALHNSTYKVSVGLMDMDTRKTTYRKHTVNLQEIGKDSLQISDLVLVDQVDRLEKGNMRISPNVMNRLNDKQGDVYLYFTAMGPQGEADVETIIRTTDGKEVRTSQDTMRLQRTPREKLIRIEREGLSYNKYEFHVRLNQGDHTADRKKEFRVAWIGLSNHISNLDKAIDQLVYIISNREINKMKNASPERKKKMFMRFWDEKDPSPETEANELMNEYYKRINYATEQFGSTIREGWRTDMGMVYVLFGAPNDIERHPFELGSKPYQVWYYYEINRQFVFVDDTGFGDYRLVTPLYDTRYSAF